MITEQLDYHNYSKKYMYFKKTTYVLGLQLYNKCILILNTKNATRVYIYE